MIILPSCSAGTSSSLFKPNSISNLVLWLDAANADSYSGGTTWKDLSVNGYNFTVNSTAYSTAGGIPHFNFEGSFGAAKRIVGGSLSNVPNFANGTFIVFSSILNSISNWRTLTRGTDHQVLIEQGSNMLGMYDNTGGGNFGTSNFLVSNIPNYTSKFNMLCWKLSSSSPYYQFQYNDSSVVGSSTNIITAFDDGFSSIGAYHLGNASMASFDQYWGKIAIFLYYSRHLSQDEILKIYNSLKIRFNL